ncbi:MAG: hypothetical protein B7Y51_09180 [Burkholderiales bacterium 28-67-8]|nr:MAG: hypothetical protein B7Y51_09180 [Burkholderiales bacterium 28-67-8]
MQTTPNGILGLAVALGSGLLIGIERERRKGSGADRQAAGVRSFTVAALLGALAQWLPVPGLVVCAAGFVALLAVASHYRSRSSDPGMTTELALFATCLIGVQCVVWPAFGAACAAVLTALLASRERLHQFATQRLTEQELHDGLVLAALALIVLPLIPRGPVEWFGGIQPRPLFTLVLLILVIQAAGHVALRALGARDGLLLSGFAAGFVSSTATIASFGSRARAHPEQSAMFAAGAALSSAATWTQVLLISAALSPRAAWALLPMAVAAALTSASLALCLQRWYSGEIPDDPAAHQGSALRLREALIAASLLGGVALLVGNAQARFGDVGLNISIAIAALVDAHAPVASLASLHAAGSLPVDRLELGVLVAVTANTLTRCTVAAVTGGRAYALRVSTVLVGSLSVAWAVGLLGMA